MSEERFVGICHFCRLSILEKDMLVYSGKPFHKRCIEKFKGLEEEVVGE